MTAILGGARWADVAARWVSVLERDVLVPIRGERSTVWVLIGTATRSGDEGPWAWEALTMLHAGEYPSGTAASLDDAMAAVVAAWREAERVQAARDRLADALAEGLPSGSAGRRRGLRVVS